MAAQVLSRRLQRLGWATWTYYNNQPGLAALRRNGMAKRFTWDRAAAEFGKLYERALERASCRYGDA